MIVRFRYEKTGDSVYIGHLEMTKLFERAFRRSGIVVKYTEGYNPSVKLNFASPLSVGIASDYEVAEVEIEDSGFERFAGLDLPAGIRLLAYKAVEKAAPLMSRLAYAGYALRFVQSPSFAEEDILRFHQMPEILFEKRTKKGSKTVNIKDFVKEIRWDEEHDTCFVTLLSGNQGALNPNALVAAVFSVAPDEVRRTFLADEDGKELY